MLLVSLQEHSLSAAIQQRLCLLIVLCFTFLHQNYYGERAYVTGSPTSASSNVQADKEYDLDTKANISGTGTVNDTSTNNQESTPTKAEKPVEKTNETDKK